MKNLEDLRAKIRGPVFSVVTPFREKDDSIDYPALENYLDYAFQAGARIFYVMGYNSRFSELSWDEIKMLNTFVTKTLKSLSEDTVVIVADPLHCPTSISMDFCQHAKDIGADMISLVFREKFYSNEQVFKHYQMCADASDIGILIHEMPFISGKGGHTVNWPVELLDRLADIPNIIAIKEDAKEDTYTKDVIDTIKDRLAVIISGGGKRQWLKFADQGCQSWLNGIGVFEPKLAVKFWQAYKQGDQPTWQRIIDEVEKPFFDQGVKIYGWHLTIKAALEIRGFFPRYERMPMLALDDNEYKIIESLMNQINIETFLK